MELASSLSFQSHGPSCECCCRFIDGNTVVVKTVTKKSTTMGNLGGDFFSDIFGGVANIVDSILNTIASVLDSLLRAISDLIAGIIKALENIDWQLVVQNLNKIVGESLIWLNPHHLTAEFFRKFPLTTHLFDEMDKITGGSLSTMDNIATLTGRALRGDAISRQELITDALFMIRVVAVMCAGPAGSAAFNSMMVAQVSGQLKQGTLGQTQLGRTLLGIAEVAGYAYFVGSSIQDAVVKKSMDEGQSYVMTSTQLGRGDMGPYVAGLAFAAGGAAYAGSDSYAALTSYSQGYARTQAINQTAERIGGPLAKDIATATVDSVASGQFDPSRINYSQLPQGYSFNQFVNDMTNAYGNVKDSIVNYMNQSGGQSSFPSIDFTGAGDAVARVGTNVLNEVARIPENLVNLASQVSFPSLSSPNFPGLSIPDVKSPSFDFNLDVDWEKLYDVLMFLGKRALYRKKRVRGKNGRYYTVYVMEDGSIYYELESNYMLWIALAAGAAAVTLGS